MKGIDLTVVRLASLICHGKLLILTSIHLMPQTGDLKARLAIGEASTDHVLFNRHAHMPSEEHVQHEQLIHTMGAAYPVNRQVTVPSG